MFLFKGRAFSSGHDFWVFIFSSFLVPMQGLCKFSISQPSDQPDGHVEKEKLHGLEIVISAVPASPTLNTMISLVTFDQSPVQTDHAGGASVAENGKGQDLVAIASRDGDGYIITSS